MIEPAGPGRARHAGSADPVPQPAVEPAAVPASGNSLVSLLAIVLVAALVGGAVAAGVTLAMLSSQARTNPQELNLRSGVTVNEESNTVQLVATAQPAVVSVVTKLGSGGTTSGSGFVVTSDGNIVTNIRVISNAQLLSVLVAGDSKPHDARIVDFDCETGLAVLKIDKVSNLRTLSFGDSNALKLGQSVVAIGGPFQGSARRGIVSGLHRTSSVDDAVNPARTDHLSDTIETDAAIDDAGSGGPLLNVSGQVVGVNMSATSNKQHVGFALASNDVQPELEQLLQTGQLAVPWLGADATWLSAGEAAIQGRASGSLIGDVTLGSPADLAGVRTGDVITQLDAFKLDDAHPLPQVLRAQFKPSQRVTMTIWRAGSTRQLELTLGSQHPTCQ